MQASSSSVLVSLAAPTTWDASAMSAPSSTPARSIAPVCSSTATRRPARGPTTSPKTRARSAAPSSSSGHAAGRRSTSRVGSAWSASRCGRSSPATTSATGRSKVAYDTSTPRTACTGGVSDVGPVQQERGLDALARQLRLEAGVALAAHPAGVDRRHVRPPLGQEAGQVLRHPAIHSPRLTPTSETRTPTCYHGGLRLVRDEGKAPRWPTRWPTERRSTSTTTIGSSTRNATPAGPSCAAALSPTTPTTAGSGS